MFIKDNNLRTEPKFIVFLAQLLALFKFCPNCKADNPLIEVYQNGTSVQVRSTCNNSECGRKNYTWNSQPPMTGTQIAAGNFQLSFAILVAGISASKVLRVFKHTGVACISLRTFFYHQHVSGIKQSGN